MVRVTVRVILMTYMKKLNNTARIYSYLLYLRWSYLIAQLCFLPVHFLADHNQNDGFLQDGLGVQEDIPAFLVFLVLIRQQYNHQLQNQISTVNWSNIEDRDINCYITSYILKFKVLNY